MLQECTFLRAPAVNLVDRGLSRGRSHDHRHRRHRGDMAQPPVYKIHFTSFTHGKIVVTFVLTVLCCRHGQEKSIFCAPSRLLASPGSAARCGRRRDLFLKRRLTRSCSTREHPRSSIIWLPRCIVGCRRRPTVVFPFHVCIRL